MRMLIKIFTQIVFEGVSFKHLFTNKIKSFGQEKILITTKSFKANNLHVLLSI